MMNSRLCTVMSATLAIGLSGCVSKYQSETPEPLAAKLQPHASFYVMMPADGQYGMKSYGGSGMATAKSIVQALSTRTENIVRATSTETLTAAVDSAKHNKAQYVVETTILNWEDRATEWSGIPDKVTLKFHVIDAGTGTTLATTTASASSKWATLGGDHPQDLLPEMSRNFVDSIF
jgi:hypothetical protein